MDMRKKEDRDKLRETISKHPPMNAETMFQLLDMAEELDKIKKDSTIIYIERLKKAFVDYLKGK